MYTIKQVAELANITIRTLHHYDQIGLLRPTKIGANRYRYYDDEALLRLQQILLYKELGMPLDQIKDILDSPNFNLADALHAHRKALIHRANRLADLITTIESTIVHVEKGEMPMSKKQLFQPFSDDQQKAYEREIRLTYGPDKVNESVRNWNSYSPTQKQQVLDEGKVLYTDIIKAIEAGTPPSAAGDLMTRWHEHLRYFYEPTLDILRGLGELYTTHPDFIANFANMHPDLGDWIEEAINHYVDELEYAEIERLLAEDELNRRGDV
jgi:DNA-binding transcriptional MerR regulator